MDPCSLRHFGGTWLDLRALTRLELQACNEVWVGVGGGGGGGGAGK
eukprot:SAG11_NODE_570_length_8454_cov_19.886655_2_plen_46_part_00